jgi:amino acid transporter
LESTQTCNSSPCAVTGTTKAPDGATRAEARIDALRWQPRRRAGKHADPGHELGVLGGLSALSLDALSSVAYGPEAAIVVLVAAGTGAVSWMVPIMLVITAILLILIFSYTQVIEAHPEGGGAYAVGKTYLGRWPAMLAGASLVIDYVLTVAVSLAVGAASLGSVFPGLAHHLLLVSLVGLAVLTAVNLFGISESAKLLMLPTALFIVSTFGVLIFGAFHSHPVSVIGTKEIFHANEAVGILLILKAFANGATAITGIEAIANSVPSFRQPRVRHAQRTELALGALLAVMLVGLAILVKAHGVVPRGHVTILAQVTAGAFGKGAAFYVASLSTALVLGLAANTSFGGLPVLLSLLAKDHRLPHAFYLRAERPVYRYGVVVLALAAAALLVGVNADTQRLIPLFTIGVFIGFTISQLGLVRHWVTDRPAKWRARAVLNGLGACLTSLAVVVALATKFTAGAWMVALAIPLLMFLFSRTEGYYDEVAAELRLGKTPPPPCKSDTVVIVPTTTVSALTEKAISTALSLGETVVAIAVAGDDEECDRIKHNWDEWKSGVPIEVLLDPHRSLVRTVLRYIRSIDQDDVTIVVLIPEIIPSKRRHEILHNQRGRLLEAVLKDRTDVVVAVLPFHIHD